MINRRSLGTACAMLAIGSMCNAQPIQDLRRQLSEELRSRGAAGSFGTLVAAADEFELSGAHYFVDDDLDTEITVLALPFSRVFDVAGAERPGLYVEGAVGWVQNKQYVGDLFSGTAPGFETSVDSTFSTISALGGVGVQFELVKGLTLTPIVNAGVSYIESEATYGGPGATVSAALLDGIALNWEAWAATAGAAARVEWDKTIAEGYEIAAIGRYDVRWTEAFETDDPAQDFSVTTQLLTLRGDVTGPTSWKLGGGDIRWRGTIGYRRFLQGDLEGVKSFVQCGGGLELSNALPGTLSVNAALILGDDVIGYSVGLGFSF